MLNFLNRLSYKFRTFMYGRYGFDILSKFSLIAALILYTLSFVFSIKLFYFASLLLIFITYYRCFSKNLDKRGRELCAFLKLKTKINAKISRRKKMFADRKQYKFFRCSNCGTYSRVPRGKGKIKITCGVCKTQMIKKT